MIPVCILKNTADTEYMKQDVFSQVESQYVMIKTRINGLLKEEPATESASNKTSCHNEYQRNANRYAKDYASGIRW